MTASRSRSGQLDSLSPRFPPPVTHGALNTRWSPFGSASERRHSIGVQLVRYCLERHATLAHPNDSTPQLRVVGHRWPADLLSARPSSGEAFSRPIGNHVALPLSHGGEHI